MLSYGVVVGIAVVLIVFQRRRLREGYRYASRVSAPLKTYLLPVPQRYRDILLKYFRYYQELSKADKSKFELKVCNFIYGKQFIPRNIDVVTEEAKVLIAASAVQLTFGLPHVYLRHFNKILVYPDNYYSSITKRYHKGEVNPRFRLIVISWQAFVDGYIDTTDSVNLGLHEMAHALRLENLLRDKRSKFLRDSDLTQFDEWAHRICSEEQLFFRPYACVNVHEFFSVAVE
ncbi:MAG TPA: zinc-dependent peptidase, partial [Chryseosolibacter sp.]|nr:zinc-dependent peptidase [Chryseosolibacter sp.]